jgi:hypothetical protein
MLVLLKRYWPALVLSALLLMLLDGALSSLLTCHPIGAQPGGGGAQKQQECTALSGPMLVSLVAIIDFLDKHGEAVTGVFTVILAIFTGRLWFSTEKLWGVTNDSVQLARDEFISSHRPRMRLKHMWLTHDTNWRVGGPLEVNLDIVNIGNTEGIVTCINYDSIVLPIGQSLPQRPSYDEMPFGPDMRITRFQTNTRLRSGITLAREVCNSILNHQEVMNILHGQRRLCMIGTIIPPLQPTLDASK